MRHAYQVVNKDGQWLLDPQCVVIKETKYYDLPKELRLTKEEQAQTKCIQDTMTLVFKKYMEFIDKNSSITTEQKELLQVAIYVYFCKINESDQLLEIYPDGPSGYSDKTGDESGNIAINGTDMVVRAMIRRDMMPLASGNELFDDLNDPNGIINPGDNGLQLVEFKLRVLRNLAKSLSVFHHKNKAHRDLKTENVRVTKEAAAGIFDFECIKTVQDLTTSTTDALLYCSFEYSELGHFDFLGGSEEYLAPERIKQNVSGIPADIYAFGIIFKEFFNAYYTTVDADALKDGYTIEVITQEDGKGETKMVSVDNDGYVINENFTGPTAMTWVDVSAFKEFEDVSLELELLQFADRCMSEDPSERPVIDGVINFLNQCLQNLQNENLLANNCQLVN